MTTGTIAAPGAVVRASGITGGLLAVLALLSAVAPFATDLYLPAFPQLAAELGADATGAQLTLTGFLVGVAAGQLLFGPLSDRFGRRGPLLAGAIALVVASAAAVVAPTLEILIAARVVQGLAGAAGMVLGRAVISDLATGPAAARAFSLMMIVGGVAPVIAPLVGGFISAPLGWRGVLAVVLAIAVAMLLAVLVVVRETHPASARARRTPGAATGARALRTRGYLGHALAFALAFAVMMAYISASPFLYQTMMGFDEVQYGLLFGVNALALMATSALSARLADRVAPRRLLGWGLTGSLAGAVLFLAIAVAGAPAPLLAVAVFVAVAPLGLVLGNATALAQAAAPGAAGLASAVLGALQFGLAALVSPLVGLGGETTAVPCGIVMAVSAAIALIAFQLAHSERTAVLASSTGRKDPDHCA
ncbi:Bcr/CflA family drug resistance efflux transporter [Microbacterium barkeri]|uniref:Bcr/CflA family drug resistance efflux transporter n=1 Tax=Microbacterium barkeri TaxID=33917 RepID=A0A9W6H2V4_9MICO|nr:multidrug effflux MFS transporter [Microbacterium barkeri]MDR6878115.1 DHA1 family bicyclomycin/chloramphenicol resistance-like MFS transporter [Microbacterium barkeri]GLJ61500.1 Bcr/CflA family drug resistance efflux transporter [Microbacterium barkeri]